MYGILNRNVSKNRMRKSRAGILAVVLMLAVVLAACGGEKSGGKAADGKLNVVTTIAQIAEPISVIGGDKIYVQSLMGPGVDPHLFTATQGDIKKLENADVVLYSGLHLEANMVKVFEQIGKSKPVLAISDTLPKDRLMKDEEGAIDPHVWFDIDLWKQALQAGVEQLKKAAPEHADVFEANKNNYFKQLDDLKKEAQDKMRQVPQEKRVLVTAHDAFGYFGRMLDTRVVGLQGLSTESQIGLTDIEDTIKLLIQYKVPAVFVESSINPDSIKAVIEGAKRQGLSVALGGELFSDAMGDANTKEGTYLGMYRHNVDTIHKALSGRGN